MGKLGKIRKIIDKHDKTAVANLWWDLLELVDEKDRKKANKIIDQFYVKALIRGRNIANEINDFRVKQLLK